MIAVKDKIWFLREGLFAKYVMALVGLVVFVLAVNGLTETWISYRATQTTLIEGMTEKAETTAKRIDQSMSELERQVSRVTSAYVHTVEQRRDAYAQLLGQVPAVAQLSQLDGQGKELLRLSRTQIALSTGIDLARDPRFTEAVARGVSYSPAYFSGTRPLMSISMAHSGFNAGVTLAEIDLTSFPTCSATPRSARTTSPSSSTRAARCSRLRRRAPSSARTSPPCRRSRR